MSKGRRQQSKTASRYYHDLRWTDLEGHTDPHRDWKRFLKRKSAKANRAELKRELIRMLS